MSGPVISFSADQFLLWGANLLLQVTIVSAIALAVAALLRHSPVLKYWVLCSALTWMLVSPVIAFLMQRSGRSLLSVSLIQESATTTPIVSAESTPGSPALQVEAATREHSRPDRAASFPPTRFEAADRANMSISESDPAAIERIDHGNAVSQAPISSIPVAVDRASVSTTRLKSAPIWLAKTLRVTMPPLLLLWLVGSVLLLTRLALAWNRLARILRAAEPNTNRSLAELFQEIGVLMRFKGSVKLVLSNKVCTPFAAGVFPPKVVLPQHLVDRLSPMQLRDVLVHEIAHIMRRDQVFVLVQNLANAMFWIHPLSRLLSRQLAQAREEVCDNYVLSATDAPSYSRTLLTLGAMIHSSPNLAGAVGLLTSRWRLEHRIAGLLDERRNHVVSLTSPGKALVLLLMMALAMASALGTITIATAQTGDTDQAGREAVPDGTAAANQPQPSLTVPDVVSVSGVVLKPDGMPASGATIRAAANTMEESRIFLGKDFVTPMSVVTADDRGRFTISITTRPYGNLDLGPRGKDAWKQTCIAATAEGFGPAWVECDEIDLEKPVTLRLVEDMAVRGRVVDLEGRPIGGTVVEVGGPAAAENEDLTKWFTAIRAGEPPWTAYAHASRTIDPRLIVSPEKVTTKEDGSFEIRGFGKERIIKLAFLGESVAHRMVSVVTRKMDPTTRTILPNDNSVESVFGAEFTFTAAPTRAIEGTVIDAETRAPLAGVGIHSDKLADYPFSGHSVLKTTTDDQGRFHLVGMPKASGNVLMAVPNDEQPYFMRKISVPDPSGIGPVPITVELHRGIWISGRVVDKVTREPVSAVRMHYLPFRTNEFAQALPEFDKDGNVDGDQRRYQTKADGTYRVVGLPGRAVLGAESILKPYCYGVGYEAIDGPKEEGTDWLLTYRNPINPTPKWPSSMVEINPARDVDEIKQDIELDPGSSLSIHLVDEQGEPVGGAECEGLSPRFYEPVSEDSTRTAINFGPTETRTIIVHHKQRKIGRVITVGPAEVTKKEIRVELLPAATVTGRLMSRDEPLPGIVIEPRVLPNGDFSKRLATVATDQDGRFTCTLLSGCQYLLFAEGNGLDFFATVVDKLTIEPGETRDLGTLTLAKDRRFVSANASKAVESGTNSGKADDQASRKPQVEARAIRGTLKGLGGEPAADAFVALVALNARGRAGSGDQSPWPELLGEVTTDQRGQFELRLSKVTSTSHFDARLIARSAESGIVWRNVNLDRIESTFDIQLPPQQLIQARLVDIEGQAAAGVSLDLAGVTIPGDPEAGLGFGELESRPKAFPPRAITDERGNFVIRNISSGNGVYLKILGDDKFAPQDLALNTGMSETRGEHDATYRSIVKNIEEGETATIPIAPAQIFEGVVLLGDSSTPAANSRITMWASQQEFGGSMVAIEGKTNADGRFRLNPRPGVRFGINAYPPADAPYLARRREDLRWDSGQASKNIEIKLDAGVLASGVIVDASTGKPVSNASVQYIPDSVHNPNIAPDTITGWQDIRRTDEEGNFTIAVLPGPGTLVVHADQQNYVLQEMASRTLEQGGVGGERMYAHAFLKIDPKAGESLNKLEFRLTPGATVEATITDENGRPVQQALVISRLKISPFSLRWRGFPDDAMDGRFRFTGLREGEEYPVYVLDARNRIGATATISTKNPNPTIKLLPCGSATARFIDPEGKPVAAGLMLGLNMIVTPGPSRFDREAMRRGELAADEDFVANIDRLNHQDSAVTNAQGEMTFPVLIPGARYRFVNVANPSMSNEFVVRSGETHAIGDIEVQL